MSPSLKAPRPLPTGTPLRRLASASRRARPCPGRLTEHVRGRPAAPGRGEEVGTVRGDTGEEKEEADTGEDTGEEVGTAGGEPRRAAREKNWGSPRVVCASPICSQSNRGVAVGRRFL